MIQSTLRARFAVALSISLLLIAISSAEIPQYLSYQGKITDTGGTPVPDGPYTMRFRIYNASSGGSLLWDSGNRSVTTSQGVASILLGESPQPALNLAFDADYWLLVTFEGVDQSPRVRLTSSGYSYMASGLVPGTEVLNEGASTAAIKGTTTWTFGAGLWGVATSTSGDTQGGRFESSCPSGRGVFCQASSPSGDAYGIEARSSSTTGRGVYGYAMASTGVNYGVYGDTNSPSGYAGFFQGNTHVNGDMTVTGTISGSGIGDITAVTAGTGLDGGATSGNATLSVEVPLSLTAIHAGPIMQGVNTSASGTAPGVRGHTSSTDGYGVEGTATAAYGGTAGVHGETASTSGYGVQGWATATTGSPSGVWGRSDATAGFGVYGWSSSGSGTTYGVFGLSSSTAGVGVRGLVTSSNGTANGVEGQTAATNGRGVYGFATAPSGVTYGVYGQANSPSGYAGYFQGHARVTGNLTVDGTVSGSGIGDITSVNAGIGLDGGATSGNATLSVEVPLGLTAASVEPIVKGINTATAGTSPGVRGETSSTDGRGVWGYASAGSGLTYGVYGQNLSTAGYGVYGIASASTGDTHGVCGESASTQGTAVIGRATASSGTTFGVQGYTSSTSGRGVSGWAQATTGTTYGVLGGTSSANGFGVFGSASSSTGTNYGGHFASSSSGGTGVFGSVTPPVDADRTGVHGYCFPSDNWGVGVKGEGGYHGTSGICNTTGSAAGAYYGAIGQAILSGATGTAYGVYGYASGGATRWGVYASGDMGCSGIKTAVVRTEEGPRAVYCQESPEVWFEDFGRGQLRGGRARVQLAGDFMQTVTIDGAHPMMVFITPGADIGRWWVEEGTREFQLLAPDAPEGAPFTYRVVAKRAGYEDVRLEPRPEAYGDHFLYQSISEVPTTHQSEWLKSDGVRNERARQPSTDR